MHAFNVKVVTKPTSNILALICYMQIMLSKI